MKSPEQMGGLPEQSNNESMKNKGETERNITTPEEAEEMTKQRRKEHGLSEISELTPAEFKEINASIEELLGRLDDYDYGSFSPEIQDEWYWVEQEAIVGKDRELAKAVLERFLNTLKGNEEKKI